MRHALDVAVFHPLAENGEAAGVVTPVENFDVHRADAPHIHRAARRLVEVNRIAARKRPADVVHLAHLARIEDAKHRAGRPARPIGGSAADFPVAQRRAECSVAAVAEMIILAVRVSRRAHALKLRASDGLFVFRQRAGAGGEKERRTSEEKQTEQ